MTIETLLSKLQKVRRTSNNSWMACCPSHNDKTPSLSIKDDDGLILMRCFGQQCGVDEIVAAVGMELHELFPPSDNYDPQQKQRRSLFHSGDVLSALGFETLVIFMIGDDMLKNGSIDQATRDRLFVAITRINGAIEYTRRL